MKFFGYALILLICGGPLCGADMASLRTGGALRVSVKANGSSQYDSDELRLAEEFARHLQLKLVPNRSELASSRAMLTLGVAGSGGASSRFSRPITLRRRGAFELRRWEVAPEYCFLLPELERFLTFAHPDSLYPRAFGDFDEIKKRGILRVLTLRSPVNYFLRNGEESGFEYAFLKRFAESHGLLLQIVLPPSPGELISYLRHGRGDLIAALDAPGTFAGSDLVSGHPYLEIRDCIVLAGGRTARELEDLAPYHFTVRADSGGFEFLNSLQRQNIRFKVTVLPHDTHDFALLDSVESGRFDGACVPDVLFAAWSDSGKRAHAVFHQGQVRRAAWRMRRGEPRLKQAVDEFFARECQSANFKLQRRRYFNRDRAPQRPEHGMLRYASIIRKYAELNNFDPNLIAAQIFQESRFRPDCRNAAGDSGLMQLRPRTAVEMRCRDVFSPEENVRAGCGYLAKLRRRIGGAVPPYDRTLFALAAYNGGFEHLVHARALARMFALNPNLWSGHVEQAYLLLEQRESEQTGLYTRCRGSLIARYVNSIAIRSFHYMQMENFK